MGNSGSGGCLAGTHLDANSIGGAQMGKGGDIDAAVLAATNFGGAGLTNKLSLSFKCE